MSTLQNYEEAFPDWIDYEQEELGTKPVLVSLIIGGNPFCSENYNGDWTPKGTPNLRYEKAKEFVEERMKKNKKSLKAIDVGWVHVFAFYSVEKGTYVYYVCGDGHRRVSACKALGVKKILADITRLEN